RSRVAHSKIFPLLSEAIPWRRIFHRRRARVSLPPPQLQKFPQIRDRASRRLQTSHPHRRNQGRLVQGAGETSLEWHCSQLRRTRSEAHEARASPAPEKSESLLR